MKSTIGLIFWIGVLTAMAQGGGEVKDLEVVIEKESEVLLPMVDRQYSRIEESEEVFEKLDVDNEYTTPDVALAAYKIMFVPKDYTEVQGRLGQKNFVKAGYGNYGSPELRAFYGIAGELTSFSANVDFESFTNGPIENNESGFSNTSIQLGGALKFRSNSFTPFLNFQNRSFFFYGHDQSANDADLRSAGVLTNRIFQNDIQGGFKLDGGEVGQIMYDLEAELGNLNVKEKSATAFNKESNYRVSGNLLKDAKKDEWYYGLGLTLEGRTYEGASSIGRSKFEIQPYVGLRGDLASIKAGLNVTTGNDTTNSTKGYFYPNLDLKWNFANSMSFNVGLDGGLDLLNLRDLGLENIFLQDSLELRNQSTTADIYLSLNKNFGRAFYAEVFSHLELVEDKAFFVNSPSDSSRFQLLYDNGTFSALSIGLKAHVRIGTDSEIDFDLRGYQYNTGEIPSTYHLPTAKLSMGYQQKVMNGLDVYTKLAMLTGLVGRSTSTLENVDLDPIVDWQIGGEYMLKDALTIYLEINNLLNRDYQRYLGYQTIGLNAKLGFIFRF